MRIVIDFPFLGNKVYYRYFLFNSEHQEYHNQKLLVSSEGQSVNSNEILICKNIVNCMIVSDLQRLEVRHLTPTIADWML